MSHIQNGISMNFIYTFITIMRNHRLRTASCVYLDKE
uniref:Uncharacterized protein n=1 Tax=Picea glauca TaxID=3330 RepID=A0A101LUG7_PICGL|nr:hypothetical protein ABT39_MTgene3446 [Picea glauca]